MPVPPRRRVLFVEVAYGGLGADYSVHAQLIETLAPTVRLEVMSLSHPDFAATRPHESYRVPCDAYYLGDSPLRRRTSALTDLPLAIRRAMPAIKEFAPDVVYSCQLRRDALAAHAISAVAGVPHVLHLHYSFGPWLGRAAVHTIRRAEHVIAISEYVRQTALLRGFPPEGITTVPNVTSPAAELDVDRPTKRAELGLGDDDVAVIAVGRLDRDKGFRELIDAVRRLDEHHHRLRVLVCGESNHDPDHGDELRRIVRDHGLGSVVRFLGHRSDIPELMNASDVFCLPSLMEPFGLVYVEAMRAGLPVVALRSGGVPEIITEDATGLLSYPGDQGALVANLATLIERPDQREKLGAGGRERLRVHFDNDTIAARWLGLMDAIIDGRGRS